MTFSDTSTMHRGISKNYSSDNSPRRVSDDIASLDSWSDALDLSSLSEQPLDLHREKQTLGNYTAKTLLYGDRKQGNQNSNDIPRSSTIASDYVPHSKCDVSPTCSTTIHTETKQMRPFNSMKKLKFLSSSSSKQISNPYSINGDSFLCASRQNDSEYTGVCTDRTRNTQKEFNSSSVSHSVDQFPHVYRTRSSWECIPSADLPQACDDQWCNVRRTDHEKCLSHHDRHQSESSRDQNQIVDGEKVKTKLMSAWNNMKYGWTLKTKANFRYDSPIYLLGQLYHRDRQVEEREPLGQRNCLKNVDEFHQDYSSRIWFTYRREFSPLAGTKMTTDCGWGCMLRSCQMMVAQGFVLHFLGREWRLYGSQTREHTAFYHEIIRWFGDHESDRMPFSLHKLVEIGFKLGKSPGDWYGPSSVSFIFRDALLKAEQSLPILSDICLYVAHDCTVYTQDVVDMCTENRKSSVTSNTSSDLPPGAKSTQPEWKRSVIILIPMRLGGESLNEIYIPCVQSMLSHDNCIGVIGGKPKHSMYFVGFQEDKLIYLDPHYCQDMVDTTKNDFSVQSFHCVSPRKLSFCKMDPSCTVGFYCRTSDDFKKFVDEAQKFVVPPKQKGQYPLFIFSDGRCTDVSFDMSDHRDKGILKIRHYRTDKDGRIRSPTMESEEFVIL